MDGRLALNDFAYAFLSIMLEGVPFILVGTLISGAIAAFLPGNLITRWLPRSPGAAVMAAGLLGAIFPMCECGAVPVIRRLMRKGLPLACGVTYLLAAPIVNPIVAISTFAAFSGQMPGTMVALRLFAGYFVAVLVGFCVLRIPVAWVVKRGLLEPEPAPRERTKFSLNPEPAAEPEPPEIAKMTLRQKTGLAVNSAVADFLEVSFYLALGASLTALFKVFVNQELIMPLAMVEPIAVGTMMIMAALLSLCSTSDAFIAATFVLFPMSAKLAFLTFGPMFDLKLIFLYRSIFRGRFIAFLGAGLYIVIGLMCWRLGLIFQ